MSRDALLWRPVATIRRYAEDDVARLTGILGRDPLDDDFLFAGVRYEESVCEGNLLTTAGLTRITSLITAAGGQGLVATSGRLGAGDGAGTAAVGDTDLSASAGSTHRWFQVLDATYPSSAAGVISMKATFASADGNFAWNEWCTDIGAPTVSSGNTVSATLLNHKTSFAQGTKTAGQAWTLSVTITLS